MDEKYLIKIDGTIEQDDDKDTVQLITKGSFLSKNGGFSISYKETQATGFEGSITTVSLKPSGAVVMRRTGSYTSEIVIEPGKRHVCHYDSGFGVLNLGVAADEIKHSLCATGGKLMFSYTLDSGQVQISHNKVEISVREAK